MKKDYQTLGRFIANRRRMDPVVSVASGFVLKGLRQLFLWYMGDSGKSAVIKLVEKTVHVCPLLFSKSHNRFSSTNWSIDGD